METLQVVCDVYDEEGIYGQAGELLGRIYWNPADTMYTSTRDSWRGAPFESKLEALNQLLARLQPVKTS